ncbi:MAG TPA: hypothetical protein VFA52_03410 [Candidatus Paceibacterota bacterium]|nr:hypothetical protein [Candidatus Paceibacterota bacterium]
MKFSHLYSRLTFSLLLILLFSFFSIGYAQNTDYNSPSLPSLIPGLEEQINIKVNPENPAPSQLVNLSLEAFGTDLNRADISWLVNGVVQKNGVGATSFEFTTGAAGSLSAVQVIILPVNGTRITKTVNISPASVDIVWEANSYVPPFYEGKRLYPPQGTLTFVALPNFVSNGVTVDPNTLVYKWRLNNSVLGDKSGYGKRTLTVTGDILNQPINVSVEASLVKNNISGSGAISVASQNPQVLLYEDSPLNGILFNKILDSQFDLTASEVTFGAFPFYFSATSPTDKTINYAWYLNNSAMALDPHQSEVVFRKPDNQNGQSAISVSATVPSSILQSASTNIIVNFSNNSSQNASF